MSITLYAKLDMTPGAVPTVVHRSQYDSDFSIVFTLFARMGNFTIASGTTAKVRGTKKSGTGYSADATVNVSAKTVTVTGDQQMTVVSGQNIFEIVLLSGTKELCSANFILDVERAALDMDTITDDTVIRELDNLDQFITEAEAAADRAEDAAATFSVDATLTVSGKAADAKTVGDAIASEDKKALAAFATDTASGAVANFHDGADSIPMKDVLVHIEPVQAGSGDPSPDNVRPITGWTGCVISHSGADMTNPTTYSITFPSSAGTVYGGTLDVTSGILTVDRAIITLSDVSQLGTGATVDSGYYVGIKKSNIAKYVSAEATVISDKMIGVSMSNDSSATNREKFRVNVASNQFLIIHAPASSGISNNNDLFSAIGTTNFVFELAAPQTYQLTPQEITSLLGTNSVWADTGDSEVEYRADTALYIGRLTEPDADMIADSNITSGQYFMVGNSLYRATSNIASGASVIVGTNAVKVSLATALNEINQ